MHERDIPDLNLFMMCETPNPDAYTDIPDGFHIRTLRPQELELWKRFPFDEITGDLTGYTDYMTGYFRAVYAPREAEFYARCLVICDSGDTPVGTCFAWRAYGAVTTVHWFKVWKTDEGKGLGRALLTAVMRGIPAQEYPIYLHTQPSSFRAIKLYTDFGFSLLTDDRIGHRSNDLAQALPYLEHFMGAHFRALRFAASDGTFSEIAAQTEHSEF